MKIAYIVLDHLFEDVCFVTYNKIDIYTFFRYDFRRLNYSYLTIKTEEDYEKFKDQLDNGEPMYIGEEIVTHYDYNVYYNTLPVTAMNILKDISVTMNLLDNLHIDKKELEVILEALVIMRKKVRDYVYKRPDVFIDTWMVRDYLKRQGVISCKEYNKLLRVEKNNGK